MKRFLLRLAWPLGIAASVALLWLWFASRPVQVTTATVSRGQVEEYVTEEAETQLDVHRTIAAERAGTINRIDLEEGDSVSAGQVVASIEDAELALTLGQLDAQLDEIAARLAGADVSLPKQSEIDAAASERDRAEAEVQSYQEAQDATAAELAYAEREYDRVKGLYETGSATDRQLDRAKADLDVARASSQALQHRVDAGRLAVKVAGLREQVLLESMDDTAHLHDVYAAQAERVRNQRELLTAEAQVRSPVDGIVLTKHVDSRVFVQPGTPLLEVGDPASIEVKSDILSDEIGRVAVGQKAYLVGSAVRIPEATARVKKIYPSGFTKISSLGVRQQRVRVLLDFDNSRLNLGPGYELDVKIVVAREDDALLVPASAVFAESRGSAVFVVQEGRARARSVEIGLRGEDDYQITDGLEQGDVVILRPPAELSPGDRVESNGKESS